MRIISQNGKCSVDFDRSTFEVEENMIVVNSLSSQRFRVLAQYSTKERAKEVFKDMNVACVSYDNIALIYQFPKE